MGLRSNSLITHIKSHKPINDEFLILVNKNLLLNSFVTDINTGMKYKSMKITELMSQYHK